MGSALLLFCYVHLNSVGLSTLEVYRDENRIHWSKSTSLDGKIFTQRIDEVEWRTRNLTLPVFESGIFHTMRLELIHDSHYRLTVYSPEKDHVNQYFIRCEEPEQ